VPRIDLCGCGSASLKNSRLTLLFVSLVMLSVRDAEVSLVLMASGIEWWSDRAKAIVMELGQNRDQIVGFLADEIWRWVFERHHFGRYVGREVCRAIAVWMFDNP
jgi:hypothetical protein